MTTGVFLLLYLPFAFILLLVTAGVMDSVATRVDRRVRRPVTNPSVVDRAPFRSPGHQRLTVQNFPRPDELFAISYLRDGLYGLRDSLVDWAFAARLLRMQGDRVLRTDVPAPDEPVLSELVESPHGTSLFDVEQRALHVAKRHRPAIVDELRTAGLVHTRQGERASRLVITAGVTIAVGVGLGRALLNPAGRGWVIAATIVVALFFMTLFFAVLSSVAGGEYLRWFDAETAPIRDEVARRRRSEPFELVLAALVDRDVRRRIRSQETP
jgi:hypothetical protein